MLLRWCTMFQNLQSSPIVNGLELLTALALTTTDGKLEDKIGAVFTMFDFDNSSAITRDEVGILINLAICGLSKATKGLGPRLAALCPMSEVAELTRQCFAHCDLDQEQDVPRTRFIFWVKQTTKMVYLLRCFVLRECLSKDDAAMVIQRCSRGMLARREAAECRLELQLEVEQALAQTRSQFTRLVPMQKLNWLMCAWRSLALCKTHASAVASNGQVLTWGMGVPGSFGVLLPSQDGGYLRKQPTRVDDLTDVVIVDSRLGSHHSIALSAGGIVYTWGSGGYGQLGHGDFAVNDENLEHSVAIFRSQFDQHTGREYPVIDLPLRLDSSYFEKMRVTQIACGYYFALAVTEDVSVFSWGEGSDGQLGLGYSDSFRAGFLDPNISGSIFVYIPMPTRINALEEPIKSVAVGGNHVFAWGAWKRRGATDTRESAFTPLKNAALSTLNVQQIAVGKEHSLAVAQRVEVSLTVDQFPSDEDGKEAEAKSIHAIALCARFGSQPAQLSHAIAGSVFAVPLMSSEFGRSSRAYSSASTASSDALNAAVYNRSDSYVRSSLARCTGKVALLDRRTSTGCWMSLQVDSTQPTQILEILCVPATFGPPLTAAGVRAQLFYSHEHRSRLQSYVRPHGVVSRIAVLEFGQEDVACDTDALDASGQLTHSLVMLVEDAQHAGAVGVVIIFDFLEADAFPLEVDENDSIGDFFKIPAVMIHKSRHGELLLEQLKMPGDRPWSILSNKEDVLGKQITTAQKAGAKAVIVIQTRVDPEYSKRLLSLLIVCFSCS